MQATKGSVRPLPNGEGVPRERDGHDDAADTVGRQRAGRRIVLVLFRVDAHFAHGRASPVRHRGELPAGPKWVKEDALPAVVCHLLEVHVPPTRDRLADLLPRLDLLPDLDARHDVLVAEVADGHVPGANSFLERGYLPDPRRLLDAPSLDGEHRVAARCVVHEDVDRPVEGALQRRHPRRPASGRVEERPVDGVGAVLRRQWPARVVVVVGGREAQRAADRQASGGGGRPNRERWHASRV